MNHQRRILSIFVKILKISIKFFNIPIQKMMILDLQHVLNFVSHFFLLFFVILVFRAINDLFWGEEEAPTAEN